MQDTFPPPAPRAVTLRELPLATRLTLAVFLISVGIGYVSALVQLHFQHASPGELLPTPDDAVRVFNGHTGEKPKSKIEQLLIEDFEGMKMTSQGQMTSAFFKRADDYKQAISDKAKALAKKQGVKPKAPAIMEAATAEVDAERHSERLAMIAWIREGASEADYNDDKFPLPDDVAKRPITEKYLVDDGGKIVEPHAVKIKTLFQERCATCHTDGGEGQKFPLEKFADIKKYTIVKTASGMSMEKLAQSSHVHLLGFSILYGLTGLILSFSSYPRLLRVLLCPLPLAAQVVDISFWWLARLPEPQGPMFARGIVISGAVVAVGLMLHIVLSLFNLFSKKAWMILILLFGFGAYSAHEAKVRVIDPYIAQEKAPNVEAK
jgi:mono/diheme cytochrome c family protein